MSSRSDIPAVTHVDYSARIQTVHAETNPLFHRAAFAFKAHTGCPVLVNTSFNVRGEPIVCTPEDAFRCFMGNEIDMLVVGNCVPGEGRAGSRPEAGLQLRVRTGLALLQAGDADRASIWVGRRGGCMFGGAVRAMARMR